MGVLGPRIFNFETTPTIEYLFIVCIATRPRPRILFVTRLGLPASCQSILQCSTRF